MGSAFMGTASAGTAFAGTSFLGGTPGGVAVGGGGAPILRTTMSSTSAMPSVLLVGWCCGGDPRTDRARNLFSTVV